MADAHTVIITKVELHMIGDLLGRPLLPQAAKPKASGQLRELRSAHKELGFPPGNESSVI
jgi:hypothetical protein